jgi:hypothetical protein
MLRDADVLPPWLEERRRLLEELDRMRKAWLRSWRRSTESSRRRQLKRQIENDLADLNRRILSYNIKAPHLNFHLRALRPADEWARLSEA